MALSRDGCEDKPQARGQVGRGGVCRVVIFCADNSVVQGETNDADRLIPKSRRGPRAAFYHQFTTAAAPSYNTRVYVMCLGVSS